MQGYEVTLELTSLQKEETQGGKANSGWAQVQNKNKYLSNFSPEEKLADQE